MLVLKQSRFGRFRSAGTGVITHQRGYLSKVKALAIDTVLELTFVLCAVEMAFRFCDEPILVDLPKFVAADASMPPRSFATNKNPLFHICDLYDTALCLRVLWILHHSHVQFFLAFAERDVCCAITCGDLKYVKKLALRR